MAALYLHNAIFAPDTSETPLVQSRARTPSAATLRTSTSDSHPTQPLLHSATSESIAYLDMLYRQPTHPSGPHPGWDMGLNLEGDPTTTRERRGYWEKMVRQRLQRLRIIKCLLEVLLGAWATYNTVRYFIAYTIYTSSEGQTVSLALGAITTISIAFMMSSAILSTFKPFFLTFDVSLPFLLLTRNVLSYVSSFLLFTPTLVNFALVFAWRNSPDPEVTLQERCHVDIDVIWSVSHAKCDPPVWGAWVAFSILRIILTLIIIITYYVTAAAYHHTRRPSRRSQRSRSKHHNHYHNPPESAHRSGSPFSTYISNDTASFNPPISYLQGHQHQASYSTLGSNTNSRHGNPSTRSSRASLRHLSSFNSQSGRPTRASSSPHSSSEDLSGDEAYFRLEQNLQHQRNSIDSSVQHSNTEGDRDLLTFVDRFRSLVSQITRETDDALEFARSDSTMLPAPPPVASSGLPDYFDPYAIPTSLYDEFGRPNPPDDHVRVLGGYIRRMPTIESMGSREVTSIYTRDHDRVPSSIQSMHTLSRPPTRANTFSTTGHTGSDPSSRTNSLTLAAELISGMSEMGEFVGDNRTGTGTGTTGTAGSHPSTIQSVTSYYTASTPGSPFESPKLDFAHPAQGLEGPVHRR